MESPNPPLESPSDDAVAQYVRKTGMATDEQIQAARKLAPTPLAEALVRNGAITPMQREAVEKKLEAGTKELGGCRLLRKLGEGGMGAVYLAEDAAHHRKVAIKVLPRKNAADPEYLKRFRREAEAAATLDHPNIVRAFLAGEDKGYHFYLMEYCEGEPLRKRIDRLQWIAHAEALEIVLEIARALEYAHGRGFIHRDIKPENIMITPSGAARILDLGLTKNLTETTDSLRTVTGAALGTPHYISPEQARGDKDVDGRSDIYSLGATFYHAMTGRTPFSGSSIFEVIQKHLMEQLVDPRDLRPEIPAGVVDVVRKMMAKSPGDRYRDCTEAIGDLERLREKRPPLVRALDPSLSSIAGPTVIASSLERVGRPAGLGSPRRKRLFAGAIGGLLLAISIAIVAWPTPKSPAPSDQGAPLAKKRPSSFGDRPRAQDPPAPSRTDPVPPRRSSTLPIEIPFDSRHLRNPDVPDSRWVELLPIVDVGRHSTNGAWLRKDEGIVSPDTGTNFGVGSARIWIPYSLPQEYEVILYVERQSGSEDLILGFVAEGRPFTVVLDGWGSEGAPGAFRNNQWQRYPTQARHVLKPRKQTRIGCFLRGGGFNLTLDGEKLMVFPDVRELGMPSYVQCFNQDDGMVIGAVRSSFNVSSIATLSCRGGPGKVIRE